MTNILFNYLFRKTRPSFLIIFWISPVLLLISLQGQRLSCIATSLMPRETKVYFCSMMDKMADVGCYCGSLPLSPRRTEYKAQAVMVNGIDAPVNIWNLHMKFDHLCKCKITWVTSHICRPLSAAPSCYSPASTPSRPWCSQSPSYNSWCGTSYSGQDMSGELQTHRIKTNL